MSQFGALLIKNFTLYKRGWVCSLLQIFIVCGVPIVVVALRHLMNVQLHPEESFVDNDNYTIILVRPEPKVQPPGPTPPTNQTSQVYAQLIVTATNGTNGTNGTNTNNSTNTNTTNTTDTTNTTNTTETTNLSKILKDCVRQETDGRMNGGGKVALAPPDDPLIQNLSDTLTSNGYEVMYFNNSDQINNHIRSPNYISELAAICFGVVVTSSVSPNYNYSLWFNITTSNVTTDGPRTDALPTVLQPFSRTNYQPLIVSGMLEIQNLMNSYIAERETESKNSSVGGKVFPMYQEEYVFDDFGNLMYDAFDFLLTLPLAVIYLRMTGTMMLEKQRKIKENMKIMGMTNTSYYGSWIVYQFIIFLAGSLFTAGMIRVALPRVDYFVVLLLYVLYSLVLMAQSLFIQVFFTRAKIAILFATFLFGLQYIMVFLFKNAQQQSVLLAAGVSASPPAGVSLALLAMVQYHSAGQSVNFSTITTPMFSIKISTVLVLLSAHVVFWFILFLYLEQVFPNEWGAKQNPLFFLQWLRSLCGKKPKLNEGISVDDAAARRALPEDALDEKNYVNISDLTKRYPGSDRFALESLTLKMIKGQIFCLLGHNGAGKTTTVGILTGMFEPTSGAVSVFGLDLKTQLNEIRKIMGVCPQHNTLYDDLTVEEHLRLFGRFKGFTGPEADAQIEQLLQDMKLTFKRHALSCTLSGGQKRRLSVGMAFVGGSQLVFLDEPTSGVDTSARRDIWQLLKQYRSKRVIILTTHFMDEADHLADQTAILSCGKLVRLGTPFNLKQEERMGYTLIIAKKARTTSVENIMQAIRRYIRNAVLESGVGMQMVVRIPRGNEAAMGQLFIFLEQKGSKFQLEIQSYGINVASLEEIFISATDHAGAHVALTEKQERREKELQQALQRMQQMEPLLVNKPEGSQFFRQFWCTFVRRGRLAFRDLKTLLFEFGFPIMLCAVVITLIRVNAPVDMAAQVMSCDLYQGEYPLPFPLGCNSPEDLYKLDNVVQYINSLRCFTSSEHVAANSYSFDKDILFPMKSASLKGGAFSYNNNNDSTNGSGFNLFVNTRSGAAPFLLTNVLTSSLIYNKTDKVKNISITTVSNPLPLTQQQKHTSRAISGFIGAVGFGFALSFKFASVICIIVKEREEQCKHQQKISGMRLSAYWVANIVFDFCTYLPIALLIGGLCHAFNLSDFVGQATGAMWTALILYAPANLLFTYLLSFLYNNHELAMAMHYFSNFILTGLVPAIIMILRTLGDNTGLAGRGIAWFLRLLPPFSFGEVLIVLARKQVIEVKQNDGHPLHPLSWPVTFPPIIYLATLSLVYGAALFILEWFLNKSSPLFSKAQVKYEAQENADSGLAIEVRSLIKTFTPFRRQPVRAVRGVDLSIERGEVFGLLGANGAGKSTLYKILTGDVVQTSGEVFMMGQPLEQARKHMWRVLGYCPQFDALFDVLTVREHLDHYYQLKQLPAEHRQVAVDAQICLLGLRKYEHVASEKLSGGNKRRLSLAIALIGEPPILLLDETSTGMDPLSRRLLWNVIAKAPREGYNPTVLLTTHSMQQAEVLSNRLSIMAGGMLKCVNTPQNIKYEFKAGYEVEVKFLIKHSTVEARCGQLGRSPQHKITKKEYNNLLNQLTEREDRKSQQTGCQNGKEVLRQRLVNSQAGKQLLERINKFEVQMQEAVEFILTTKLGILAESSLTKPEIGVKIVEQFDAFYCFRLQGPVQLSRLFVKLERAKTEKLIQEYSIKQGSIEHIFNSIVEEQEMRDAAERNLRTAHDKTLQLQEGHSRDNLAAPPLNPQI